MAERPSIPIIILAAGLSTRMRGRDKLTELIDGMPLLARQVARAVAATQDRVVVTLPPAPHPRHDVLEGLAITRVEVPDAADGMSVSLRAGLSALPKDAVAAMILLPDLPELTTGDLVKVMSAVTFKDDTRVWRGTTADGAAGHPVVVAAPLFAEIMSLSGDTGGAEVLKHYRENTRLIALPEQHARLDLDTPEDWDAWRATRRDQTGK